MAEVEHPYIDEDEIASGKRLNVNACQYWIKGISGVCIHWANGDPGECTFDEETVDSNGATIKIIPSRWNNRRCDFQGRRANCDKYEVGDEDLTQYMCIACNPFMSGLTIEGDEGLRRSIRKSEIEGFNDDGEGIGQCDKYGGGKGVAGYGKEGSDYDKLPVVCNYYRPWQMGFGAVEPKTTSRNIPRDADGHYIDEREELEERLPFNIRVRNVMSKVQKCAYWDKDVGSSFILAPGGLCLEEEEEGEDIEAICICPDEAANPFHTVSDNAPTDMLLENVWADGGESTYGTIICNGAHPGCPCYTGKWHYCIDEKTEDGDKISGQQIMELRYWMNEWASQEEYNRAFERPPNINDPSTSDIYTFESWESFTSSTTNTPDYIMRGQKIHMCVPTYESEFNDDILVIGDIKYKQDKGTSVKGKENEDEDKSPPQRSFPSLVRDLDYLYFKPLNIIYPYANKDPFDPLSNPLCTEDRDRTPCIKRNNSIDGDALNIFGNTVRNKSVYAFNIEFVQEAVDLSMINDYDSKFNIEGEFLDEFYKYIKILISSLEEQNLIYKSTSDEDGFFYIGPVTLKYQRLNTLVICADFGDGTYDFRKRNVWSQWHGGAVLQCDTSGNAFNHEYGAEAYGDEKQHVFTPPATAAGMALGLKGAPQYETNTLVESIINVYSDCVKVLGFGSDFTNYSYCIKKVTKKDVSIDRYYWKRADNAGTLWIEIDDLNLNYIFGCNVTKIILSKEENDGSTTSLELGKVHPADISSFIREQIYIPPNVCVARPLDSNLKLGFFKSDGWTIKVDYWYCIISTSNSISEGEEIIWPSFGGSNRFVSSPTQITYDAGESDSIFSISNIRLATVAIMGLFTDEDGRLISAVATKICVDIVRVFCRNVEIDYRWSAEGKKYRLFPDSGWALDMPQYPQAVGTAHHSSQPPCGDHEISLYSGRGPLWYPFEICDPVEYYDVFINAAQCVAPHDAVSRQDYRMQGPERYVAYAGYRSGSGQTCSPDWIFEYSEIDWWQVSFTGHIKIKKRINSDWYRAMEWNLPPFGNNSREYVERYISMDSINYVSLKTGEIIVRRAWMPMMIDDKTFYLSFNSFDKTSFYDPFSHVNQLNFFEASSENIGSERHTFDEIFEIRRMIWASYPPPMIIDGSSYAKVCFYKFKNESHIWAWQERWKEIERKAIGETKLNFIELERPKYEYSMYKEEHRIIPEEGYYDLIFTAPEIDTDRRKMTKFPSLKLEDGDERWFDILYDNESGNVIWKDEDQGEVEDAVSGSGGDEEENIYEKTSGDEWLECTSEESDQVISDKGFLYDSEAFSRYDNAKDADREIEISYDYILEEWTKKVYNRGVIVSVPRNRLEYLPYEETEVSDLTFPEADEEASRYLPGIYKWYGETSITIQKHFGTNECINKIEIAGFKGVITREYVGGKMLLCTPGIKIELDGETVYESGYTSLRADEIAQDILDDYSMDIDLGTAPSRMITDRASLLRIILTAPEDYGISLFRLNVYKANYIDSTETIKIWERKYNVSTGGEGVNLDGPQNAIMFDFDRDMSGVYFFQGAFPNSFSGRNKFRSAYAAAEISGDEDITASDAADVINEELESQKKLYEEAMTTGDSDEQSYSGVFSPSLVEFFDEIGVALPYGLPITIKSEKLPWEKHYTVNAFDTYPLWLPGGHYWRPSNTMERLYCYWPISPLYDVYRKVDFVHFHPPGREYTEEYVPIFWAGVVREAYHAARFAVETGQKLIKLFESVVG